MAKTTCGYLSGFVALTILALLAPSASAQSLAEIARQGQDGKQPVAQAPEKGQKRVFTNRDLGPGGTAPAAPPAPTAPPTQAEKNTDRPTPPKPAEQSEVRDEAWWRKRITTAQADLQRNELFLEALQSRVNALSTNFVSRDDPVQRAQIGADRQRTLAEMERVRADIAKLKKQIVEIEEEARVAGVPPGWLR
ncbi:MAG TPA: hypothetical protein VHI98_06475 [Vicinamibacterales bacterium]|jgi:hypothetical protein|nr:hypothetical protein [Vicinamibacterales bacterium]HEX2461479.1 hypothetical protein [Vicinamibacterales bacterium]